MGLRMLKRKEGRGRESTCACVHVYTCGRWVREWHVAGHTGGVTRAAAALMGQACWGFTCIDRLERHPLSGNVSPKQCTERMTGQLVFKQSLCAGGQVSHMDFAWRAFQAQGSASVQSWGRPVLCGAWLWKNQVSVADSDGAQSKPHAPSVVRSCLWWLWKAGPISACTKQMK